MTYQFGGIYQQKCVKNRNFHSLYKQIIYQIENANHRRNFMIYIQNYIKKHNNVLN